MKASDRQVGGNHYKDFPIQPGEFYTKNKLGGLQSAIVARICRYDKPTGKGLQDLEKIKHEVDLIIEWEGWGEAAYWEKKPILQSSLPMPNECKCGAGPYMNWGNGQYWIECPRCHAVGQKSMIQRNARDNWNGGEIDYVKGI